MKHFISQKRNAGLVAFALSIKGFLLKAMQNIHEIRYHDPGDLQKLKELKGKRVLYVANHPSTAEPPVTYVVAAESGDPLYFMGSRQVFEWSGGLVGAGIRRLGAYSVIAGMSDREALRESRKLLSQPAGKLVIYPEGEPTSGENENLMPFQPGGVQLAFWSLQDALEQDPEADILIQPMFIQYTITSNEDKIRKTLEKRLAVMEKTLSINPENKGILRRFLTIGRILLEQAELKYNIRVEPGQSFDFRVGRLRHVMLDQIDMHLKYPGYPRDSDAIVKLRYLFSAWEMSLLGLQPKNYPVPNKADMKWLKAECIKIFDFIVLKRGYIMEKPSPERLFEWLSRLESYMYGNKPRALGGLPSPLPRKAHVFLGEQISTKAVWDDYKKDKKAVLAKMNQKVFSEISGMLEKGRKMTKPLVAPISQDKI